MEGVRPAIRVRIDQCREKKSYINIYYVDKSVDKSSLARSPCFSLSVSISAFFLLASPAFQSNPKSSPSHLASIATRATWEDGAGEQTGRARGSGSRDSRSVLRPGPPPKAGGGCFGPGRLPPSRRAVAGWASSWWEEGRSERPGPLACQGARKALGAVAGEPARGTDLIFTLVCFTGSNWKKTFLFFYFFLNSPSKK